MNEVASELKHFYKEIDRKECEQQFLTKQKQLTESYKVLAEKFREVDFEEKKLIRLLTLPLKQGEAINRQCLLNITKINFHNFMPM